MRTPEMEVELFALAKQYIDEGYKVENSQKYPHADKFDLIVRDSARTLLVRVEDLKGQPTDKKLIEAKSELELIAFDSRIRRGREGIDFLLVGVNMAGDVQEDFIRYMDALHVEQRVENLDMQRCKDLLICNYIEPRIKENTRRYVVA